MARTSARAWKQANPVQRAALRRQAAYEETEPMVVLVTAGGDVDLDDFMFSDDPIPVCPVCPTDIDPDTGLPDPEKEGAGTGRLAAPTPADPTRTVMCKKCKGAGVLIPKASWPVGEMTKFFFGKSANWTRLSERGGDLALVDATGEPIQVRSHRNPQTRARYYTLYDVERMAHALASHGDIPVELLQIALQTLAGQSRMYDLLGHLPSSSNPGGNHVRSNDGLRPVGAHR